ncbi:MAG: amidohydrolase [Chitinophagaceae bacterium]|nr:MAG: amidohydrolase [Chitinophagaceae bacterium]
MQRSYLAVLPVILLILQSCQSSKKITADPAVQPEKTYLVKNVNIITMNDAGTVIENAHVLIAGNRIQSINGSSPDKDAVVIDGKGKWLIPGLADMHVHNLADVNLADSYPTKGATLFTDTQDFMLLYIANGVTTVLELSGRVEHFAQRNEIVKHKVIGPRIALAMLIEGEGTSGNIANTPEQGRQTVRLAKAQGYEFIKVYSRLNVETFKAIVDEAFRQGLKVVGHIPNAFKGKLEDVFVPHFDMVAHAEEYAKQSETFSDADAERFARLARSSGTWLTPTLVTMERIAGQARSLDEVTNQTAFRYVHPLMQSKWLTSNNYHKGSDPERIAYFEKLIAFHGKLVRAFKEAGVPMVAGTDAGTSGVIWGFSLHDELELLVKAGLSSGEALASATRLPAIWLGISDKTGTVETGKLADLVLLDANPLDNISNVRKIAGVFANGEWIDRKRIHEMLARLAEKNKANQNKFEWKNRAAY